MTTLDATVRCAEDGCRRHVWLPDTRCPDHGGYGPWYESDEWGEVVHFSGGDNERRPTETA